jgi:hypothetical protein
MNEVQACERIASIAADYRQGEIVMDAQRVQKWSTQLNEASRSAVLTELAHVFERTYVSRTAWTSFLKSLIRAPKLVGSDPASFWKQANFFNQQKRGGSQAEMLKLFDETMTEELGFGTASCGSSDGPLVYLDDVICTATHVLWDLTDWLKSAPQSSSVHIIAIASHNGRIWNREQKLQGAARAIGKQLKTTWWRALALEAEPGKQTEILHPRSLPEDPQVATLAARLQSAGHPIVLRSVLTTSANKVFSSESGRQALEEEFLKAGALLKYDIAPYLKENHWPLGYDVLKTMGFGTLLVTFRNCPNNCPLPLWCGDPWFPLFPRQVN